jgi:hypothetical protein
VAAEFRRFDLMFDGDPLHRAGDQDGSTIDGHDQEMGFAPGRRFATTSRLGSTVPLKKMNSRTSPGQ